MKLWCQHPGDLGRSGRPLCGRELIEDNHGPDFTYWNCPEHGVVVLRSADEMDGWPFVAAVADDSPLGEWPFEKVEGVAYDPPVRM